MKIAVLLLGFILPALCFGQTNGNSSDSLTVNNVQKLLDLGNTYEIDGMIKRAYGYNTSEVCPYKITSTPGGPQQFAQCGTDYMLYLKLVSIHFEDEEHGNMVLEHALYHIVRDIKKDLLKEDKINDTTYNIQMKYVDDRHATLCTYERTETFNVIYRDLCNNNERFAYFASIINDNGKPYHSNYLFELLRPKVDEVKWITPPQ